MLLFKESVRGVSEAISSLIIPNLKSSLSERKNI